MTEPWMSLEQIVERSGITRDSIYRWIDHKGLPAHRVGRLWQFKDLRSKNGAGGSDEPDGKDSRNGW